MIISEEVEKKIRYLCQQIWDDEWSGILFYKPEGSFEDNTLVIKCTDIYVMDIGTSAYTEFDMSPDVISYMTNNPELLDCQMGLIHSHAGMQTFFSGTDTATLKKEGMDRNHFVSLIVNNEGKYTAAITRKVKGVNTITETVSYLSFGGEEKTSVEEVKEEVEELQWFYLNIEIENSSKEDINDRLKEIREAKSRKSRKSNLLETHDFSHPTKRYSSYLEYFKPEKDDDTTIETKDEDTKAKPTSREDKSIIPMSELTKEETEETEEEPFIPYETITIRRSVIKSLVLQLVTGSIIISDNSKVNLDKWVNGMSTLYEKRFGKGIEGLKLFRAWAESYIEFLCWFSDDDSLEELGYDKDEIAMIYAYNLAKELSRLKKNIYIKEYIDILNSYIR